MSYPSEEKQSVYSTAPAKWANKRIDLIEKIQPLYIIIYNKGDSNFLNSVVRAGLRRIYHVTKSVQAVIDTRLLGW